MRAVLKSMTTILCGSFALVVVDSSLVQLASGAECHSPNFRVIAPSKEIAREVSSAAERFRKSLAVQWYGHELPKWGERCQVTVKVGRNLGAGGSTKFRFDRGEVYGWRMHVQGSLERILDSVIPHEVNHTILACYFRRKVPRWADEGAATIVEHQSEKQRQIDLAARLVNQGRRIPLRVLLSMTQYPNSSNEVLAMYAQGFSLTEFLLQRGGRQHFLRFLNDAHHQGWDRAIAAFYSSRNIEDLEQKWASWVLAGSPAPILPKGQLLAGTGESAQPTAVIRSQNPDEDSGSRGAVPIQMTSRTKSIEPIWVRPNSPKLSDNSANGTDSPKPAVALARVGRFSRHLSAPDPRARTRATEEAVPEPRDLTPETTTAQPLQPLALTRIDGPSAPERAIPDRVQEGQMSLEWPTEPHRSGTAGALEGTTSALRETHLRAKGRTEKSAQRFFNWTQFPSRVR